VLFMEKKKFLDKEEFKKLLDLTKLRRRCGNRDYVLFLIAGNLGLRVGEVVRLRKQDFNFEKKTVAVPTLKQRSKGPLGKDALPEIYIELPADHILNNEIFKEYFQRVRDVWLFGGRRIYRRLSENAAQKIFMKYMRKLGLNSTFHSLRHFRGDSVYKSSFDLKAVQTTLRHTSVKYASTYVHPGLKEIRKYLDNGGFVE